MEGGMPVRPPPLQPGPRPVRIAFVPTVVLSMAGVAALAVVQHRLVLGVPLHLRFFAVPLLAGAIFGTMLALVRRSRARESSAREALAIRDAEITSLNEALEERARARAAEIEQKSDALLRAQRLEVLGRVAGGVAHDFNNILTAIIGCASALRDEAGRPDSEGRRAMAGILDELDDCAERARVLTAQLLTLGRSTTARNEAVDLRGLVERVAPMLRRIVGEGIELRLDAGPEDSNILADRSQIEQLLLNLVVNARDATPPGGILEVAVDRVKEGIRLRVIDNGAGMDEATRVRIFEPFFTTKAAGRGTGLGLAVVAEVARRAGARVEVDSHPGLGSSFTVVFPPTDERPARAEKPRERGNPARPLAVLLVDDDDGVRRRLAAALSAAGHRVLDARDGPGAERVVAGYGTAFDAVVCDVVLPGTSGPALVERLRARGLAAPVVFISGYSREQIDLHGGAGSVVLQKPFAPEELLARLAAVGPASSRPAV
jgi:signal transduction histidine kinase/CheY-like chemotaxis protein